MKKIGSATLVLFLFIAGVTLGFFCYDETFITTLLEYHDKNVYNSYTNLPITAGSVIHGYVTAAYNNFGALKIRLNTFGRFNSGHLTFRIRNVGNSDWIATNTYVMDRFPDELLYPFGFAPITDSKGKTFEFELFSQDGDDANSVGVIKGYHSVATQYNFQKSQLVNKQTLMSFIKAKLITCFIDPYFYLYMFLFCIPALFVFLRLVIRDKKLLYQTGMIFGLYLAFTYAYLPVAMNSNTILYIAAVELGLAYFLNISSDVIFMVAILLLIQIPPLLFVGHPLPTNRIAGLELFFIIIGIIMLLRDWNKKII